MSSATNYDAPPQVGSGGIEIERPTKRFPNIPDLIHDESNAQLLSSLLPALDKYKCLDPPFKRKRSPWVQAYCDLYHPSGPWGSSKFLNAPDIEKKTKYSFKGYKMQSIYRNLQSYTGNNAIHKELHKRLQDFYETKEKYFDSFIKSCEEIAYVELAKDAKDRAPIPGSIVELQAIVTDRATSGANNGTAATLDQDSNANTVDEPAPKRQRLEDSNDNGIVVLPDENHNAVNDSIENANHTTNANECNIIASNQVSTDDARVKIVVDTDNSNAEDDSTDDITDNEDRTKSRDSSNNDSKEGDDDNNEDQEFDTQFETNGNEEIENSKQAKEDEEPSISVPKGSKVSGNTEDGTNTSSNATDATEKSIANVVVTPSKGDTIAYCTSIQGTTSDNNQVNESNIPLLEKKREDLFKLLTKRRAYLGNEGQDDNICAKMMKAIDHIDNTLVDALLDI